MDFVDSWESATAVLGWGTLKELEDDPELVQIRGTYENFGWFRQRNVILLKGEGRHDLTRVWPLRVANQAVVDGFLRSDIEEVDALSGGTKVTAVLGDDKMGLYRTNGAHTGIIRDRIAASELAPSDDLLRCLRGSPASAERLAAIDLDAVKRRAGSGRVPTEEERVARIRPLLVREEIRRQAVRLLAKGYEEHADALFAEVLRMVEEAKERHQAEFEEVASS